MAGPANPMPGVRTPGAAWLERMPKEVLACVAAKVAEGVNENYWIEAGEYARCLLPLLSLSKTLHRALSTIVWRFVALDKLSQLRRFARLVEEDGRASSVEELTFKVSPIKRQWQIPAPAWDAHNAPIDADQLEALDILLQLLQRCWRLRVVRIYFFEGGICDEMRSAFLSCLKDRPHLRSFALYQHAIDQRVTLSTLFETFNGSKLAHIHYNDRKRGSIALPFPNCETLTSLSLADGTFGAGTLVSLLRSLPSLTGISLLGCGSQMSGDDFIAAFRTSASRILHLTLGIRWTDFKDEEDPMTGAVTRRALDLNALLQLFTRLVSFNLVGGKTKSRATSHARNRRRPTTGPVELTDAFRRVNATEGLRGLSSTLEYLAMREGEIDYTVLLDVLLTTLTSIKSIRLTEVSAGADGDYYAYKALEATYQNIEDTCVNRQIQYVRTAPILFIE